MEPPCLHHFWFLKGSHHYSLLRKSPLVLRESEGSIFLDSLSLTGGPLISVIPHPSIECHLWNLLRQEDSLELSVSHVLFYRNHLCGGAVHGKISFGEVASSKFFFPQCFPHRLNTGTPDAEFTRLHEAGQRS